MSSQISVGGPAVAPLLAATASPAEVKAALQRDGFAILPNVLSPELCDRLLGAISRYIKGEGDSMTRVLVQDFHGRKTFRFFDLLNAPDNEWQELPIHPKILPVIKSVLGAQPQLGTLGTVSSWF